MDVDKSRRAVAIEFCLICVRSFIMLNFDMESGSRRGVECVFAFSIKLCYLQCLPLAALLLAFRSANSFILHIRSNFFCPLWGFRSAFSFSFAWCADNRLFLVSPLRLMICSLFRLIRSCSFAFLASSAYYFCFFANSMTSLAVRYCAEAPHINAGLVFFFWTSRIGWAHGH